jgi:AcrR family transcriptional regulator
VVAQPAPAPRAPRADARRNVEAILRAAETCLARDPEATVAAIAAEAGVGRVTLYGHFPSRADLVGAVFAEAVRSAEQPLSQVDTDGDPVDGLRALVSSSWRVVHRFRSILAAAERELSPADVRGHHDAHLARLSALLERGRASGAFRTDVPTGWLAATCMSLMHTAAAEVSAGRLADADAEYAVVETVLAACGARGG